MPLPLLFLAIAVSGALLLGAGVAILRRIGAHPAVARRLAGPPEVRVGRLSEQVRDGSRPVRVTGRIRCRDPLEAGGGERLVAYHRDVEVRVGGRWRPIERLRETRSFDLWDHDGSVTLDPSTAAEPLIVIPKVWRGTTAELEEPHASVVARLAERHGSITEARAITRTINVADRLLVLARPSVDAGGRVRLEPPAGGFLLANLALDDAMRLLGGRHRRLAAVAVIAQGIGVAAVAMGVVAAAASALLGR